MVNNYSLLLIIIYIVLINCYSIFNEYLNIPILNEFMDPKNIAIIGSSTKPHSVGFSVTKNVIDANKNGRTIYPINPKYHEVYGRKCYRSLFDIEGDIDLAIIATSASTVLDLVDQSAKKGVSKVIILASGFSEIGIEGKNLENKLIALARKLNIRIIGPNCLGIMNPYSLNNSTFATNLVSQGSIGFASQSGAICTSLLDHSDMLGVGLSSFISLGAMSDISWGDVLSYFAYDTHTKAAGLYIESIGDPKAFYYGAIQLYNLNKPLFILRGASTEASKNAAQSHTGALVGDRTTFESVIESTGAIL